MHPEVLPHLNGYHTFTDEDWSNALTEHRKWLSTEPKVETHYGFQQYNATSREWGRFDHHGKLIIPKGPSWISQALDPIKAFILPLVVLILLVFLFMGVKKLTRWAKTKWGGKTGPNLLKEHFL